MKLNSFVTRALSELNVKCMDAICAKKVVVVAMTITISFLITSAKWKLSEFNSKFTAAEIGKIDAFQVILNI